jgi:hypothetical protein
MNVMPGRSASLTSSIVRKVFTNVYPYNGLFEISSILSYHIIAYL